MNFYLYIAAYVACIVALTYCAVRIGKYFGSRWDRGQDIDKVGQ